MLNLTELNYSLLNIHVTLPVMVWTAHLHIHQDTQEGARGQVLGPTLPSGQSVTSPILSKKHKDSQNVLSVPRCTFTRVFFDSHNRIMLAGLSAAQLYASGL